MYNGEHSINFGPINGAAGVNTWSNWYLIPTTRPTMTTPGAQNKFIEVQGMSGSLDVSDYLVPYVTFSDRTGTFEFVVDNDHANWLTIYDTIAEYLHGKRLRMSLTDDLNWYYEGRFTLDEWKSDKNNSKIVIGYRVAPFKISNYGEFVNDILWDPFCFETDIDWSAIYHIQSKTTAQTINVDTFGTVVKVRAKLVSGGPVYVSFGGGSKTLSTIDQIVDLGNSRQNDSSPLTFSGAGVIDIGWRKLSL